MLNESAALIFTQAHEILVEDHHVPRGLNTSDLTDGDVLISRSLLNAELVRSHCIWRIAVSDHDRVSGCISAHNRRIAALLARLGYRGVDFPCSSSTQRDCALGAWLDNEYPVVVLERSRVASCQFRRILLINRDGISRVVEGEHTRGCCDHVLEEQQRFDAVILVCDRGHDVSCSVELNWLVDQFWVRHRDSS